MSRSTPMARGSQSSFEAWICNVSPADHRPTLRLQSAGPRSARPLTVFLGATLDKPSFLYEVGNRWRNRLVFSGSRQPQ